jgi:hypothetical protein
MTMTVDTFRPEILNSPPSLMRFLSGEDEVRAIQSILTNNQNSAVSALYADRWDVAYLPDFKEIYHYLYASLLTLISCALSTMCMRDFSNRVWVLSKHEYSEAEILKTQRVFQGHFLASSINTHRLDTADFYLQSPIQVTLPGQNTTRQMEFFQDKGICRGMCYWFAFLFFKTLDRATDPQEYIRAIGKQFEQGAPMQAAFLQAISSSHSPLDPAFNSAFYGLLNLHAQQDYLRIDPRSQTPEQIVEQLQNCGPGVYGLYIGMHQMLYIKWLGTQHQFLFDPSRGVFKVDSPALFKEAIGRHLQNANVMLIDRYTQIP